MYLKSYVEILKKRDTSYLIEMKASVSEMKIYSVEKEQQKISKT